nr:zinc finger, GRF-type [Tanacetum cinerariifolium]
MQTFCFLLERFLRSFLGRVDEDIGVVLEWFPPWSSKEIYGLREGAIAACALPWLTSLPLQHASFIMSEEASLIALSSLYQIMTGAITHGTRGRGGQGKSIGHSISNVSHAYDGQRSYSGGRGKSVGQSSYNVRKAYVTDEGMRRTIESYLDLRVTKENPNPSLTLGSLSQQPPATTHTELTARVNKLLKMRQTIDSLLSKTINELTNQSSDSEIFCPRERIKELELRTQQRKFFKEELFKDMLSTEEELAYHKELLGANCGFVGWLDPPMYDRVVDAIPDLLRARNELEDDLKNQILMLRERDGAIGEEAEELPVVACILVFVVFKYFYAGWG